MKTITVEKTQKNRRRRRMRHSKKRFGGLAGPSDGCPRVEAIEVSELAIAFASYIEGDTGLLIILIVMAVHPLHPWDRCSTLLLALPSGTVREAARCRLRSCRPIGQGMKCCSMLANFSVFDHITGIGGFRRRPLQSWNEFALIHFVQVFTPPRT